MDKIKNKGSVRSSKKSSKSDANNENKRKVKKNTDKKIERSKKDKYVTISSQNVIKDLKNSAKNSLNSVRNTFDNLSNRLKLSSIGNQEMIVNSSDGQSYHNLGADKTPIRLYSPFGFETPSPRLDRTHLKRSCRRQMFFSPTAKIKEDVLYLNNGIKELNLISEGIENRVSSSSSLSVDHNNQSLI